MSIALGTARARLLRVFAERANELARDEDVWLDEQFALAWRLARGETLTVDEHRRIDLMTNRLRAMLPPSERLPADVVAAIQEVRRLLQ